MYTETTLCYIEHDGAYLMLHRVKKKNDLNEGKWVGVGGHLEPGETPDRCIRREVLEETGLTLTSLRLRGTVDFISDRWVSEIMYLYTADSFTGSLIDCNEGVLKWIPKEEIPSLPQWEGDRIFFDEIRKDRPFFHLRFIYHGDHLVSAALLPRLILASASPRRRELLEGIDLLPEIIPSLLPEHPKASDPEGVVRELSRQKAYDIAGRFAGGINSGHDSRSGNRPESTDASAPSEDTGRYSLCPEGTLIIGADTVVSAGGRILGKPRTHEEAADMIRLIAGGQHEVYTGVTILRIAGPAEADFLHTGKTAPGIAPAESGPATAPEEVSFVEKTSVRVYPMTEEEILAYADSDEPMDKAGAYAIQGRFAAYIKGIDGDYSSVVGLPVGHVFQALRQLTNRSRTDTH